MWKILKQRAGEGVTSSACSVGPSGMSKTRIKLRDGSRDEAEGQGGKAKLRIVAAPRGSLNFLNSSSSPSAALARYEMLLMMS